MTRLSQYIFNERAYIDSCINQLSDVYIPDASLSSDFEWIDGSLYISVSAQGIQGIQGISGTIGIDGVQGIQGIEGSQGTQGTLGSQGIQSIAMWIIEVSSNQPATTVWGSLWIDTTI